MALKSVTYTALTAAAAIALAGSAVAQERGEYYEEAQDLMNQDEAWEPTEGQRGPALSPLNPNATGNPIAVRVQPRGTDRAEGQMAQAEDADGLALRPGATNWSGVADPRYQADERDRRTAGQGERRIDRQRQAREAVTAEDLDVELDRTRDRTRDREWDGTPGYTAPTRSGAAMGAFSADPGEDEWAEEEWTERERIERRRTMRDDRDWDGTPGYTAPTRSGAAMGAFSADPGEDEWTEEEWTERERAEDRGWQSWEGSSDRMRRGDRTSMRGRGTVNGEGVFSQPEDRPFYGEEDENTAFGGGEFEDTENPTMGMDRPEEFGADTGDIGRLGEEHEGYGPGLATGQSGGPGARTTGPGNISAGATGAGAIGAGG